VAVVRFVANPDRSVVLDLERRLIRHGELDSVDHLADPVIEFIKAYNRAAKPFRWTSDAPLKVA
jgi:hypothetical protein